MNLLFVIDNLGVGGAEKLLVNTILYLPKNINCIVVYLNKPDDLVNKIFDCKVICLGFNGINNLYGSVRELRKIIEINKVDVVHAHLFYSTIIARLACPSGVKLVFSVHSIFSLDISQNNKAFLLLEKLTYSKRQVPVFVSNTVKEDYENHVGIKGASYILYDFVEEDFFLKNRLQTQPEFQSPLRLVAVGNLKPAKNYQFIIEAFKEIREHPITLDIFGDGSYRKELERMLKVNQIKNIHLMGVKSNIADLMKEYNVFIMASKNEGFCIAVAEAMAIGLPCLLSDIKTFREISDDKALFFDLSDPSNLIKKLKCLEQIKPQLIENAKQSVVKAESFRRERYITDLLNIYHSVM